VVPFKGAGVMRKRKKGALHCCAARIQTTNRNSLNKSRDLREAKGADGSLAN
jgi:hypothetical protein